MTSILEGEKRKKAKTVTSLIDIPSLSFLGILSGPPTSPKGWTTVD